MVGEEGFFRAMERHRTMRAYSAGGVVFRLVPVSFAEHGETASQQEVKQGNDNLLIEVALVGRSRTGIWVLPKGTPQTGETVEQVALREVQEETGLKVRLVGYLGSISFSFVRGQVRYHKQVRHFLFEAIGGDVALHDHEYDLAEWFPLPEACRHLTYRNEINMLYKAEDVLQRQLQHRQKEGLK